MSKITDLRKWRNGEVFNARDYVYERNLITTELTTVQTDLSEHIDDETIHFTQAEINITPSQVQGLTEDLSDFTEHIGQIKSANPHQLSLDDLTDVEVAGAPTGNVLRKAADGNWVSSNLEDFSTTFATDEELSTHTSNADIHFEQGDIEITESQISDLDKYTQEEVDDLLDLKADTTTLNEELFTKVDKDISRYDAVIEFNNSDTYYVYQDGAKKVDLAHLKAYLTTELTGIQIQVVSADGNGLPDVSDPQPNFIYLVQDSDPVAPDIYDEYVYVNDAWEYLGVRDIELSQFYQKDVVDEKIKVAKTIQYYHLSYTSFNDISESYPSNSFS